MNEHPLKDFIDLINFDQKSRSMHDAIQKRTDEIQVLKEQEKQLHESLENFKANAHKAKKAVELQELEMKEFDQKEQEKKKQLDEVSNYKEYQPIKREIETLKRMQADGEELLMDLWNKMEVAQKELDAQRTVFDEKLSSLQKAIEEREQGIAKDEADLVQRSKEREAKMNRIPEEWRDKYNLMSMQVNDPVVPVLQDSCSACFYALPQHELLRLKRRALIQCKGCFRLLYMEDIVDEAA